MKKQTCEEWEAALAQVDVGDTLEAGQLFTGLPGTDVQWLVEDIQTDEDGSKTYKLRASVFDVPVKTVLIMINDGGLVDYYE